MAYLESLEDSASDLALILKHYGPLSYTEDQKLAEANRDFIYSICYSYQDNGHVLWLGYLPKTGEHDSREYPVVGYVIAEKPIDRESEGEDGPTSVFIEAAITCETCEGACEDEDGNPCEDCDGEGVIGEHKIALKDAIANFPHNNLEAMGSISDFLKLDS
jgi:hypothetical protein